MSPASNLVEAQDTNGADNIYVRDLEAKTTVLASAGRDGGFVEAESRDPALSADGRFIAFDSNGPLLGQAAFANGYHVYERDIATGAMSVVDRDAHGGMRAGFSVYPEVSFDGGRVAFISDTVGLVQDDTNGVTDVFLRDVVAGTTVRLSVSTSGRQGNGPSGTFGVALADDGGFAAFSSSASNLVRHDTNGDLDAFLRGPLSLR
jgi:Tol biopolymer transport system component